MSSSHVESIVLRFPSRITARSRTADVDKFYHIFWRTRRFKCLQHNLTPTQAFVIVWKANKTVLSDLKLQSAEFRHC